MKRLLLSLITVLVWPAASFANGNDNWPMCGWGRMMNWWYGGIFMWILFVIVIVIVVLLITKIMKPRRSDSSFKESSIDILKRRYARGEITKEEFERMKKDLQG
jgi:putative membrane protein